jgi:hypothetical protein
MPRHSATSKRKDVIHARRPPCDLRAPVAGRVVWRIFIFQQENSFYKQVDRP